MYKLTKLLNQVIFYNKVENWCWFFGILVIGFLFKRIFSILVSKLVYFVLRRENRKIPVSQFVELLKRPLEFLITLLIIYVAREEINLPKKWRIIPLGKIKISDFTDKVLDMLFIIAITWLIIRLIKFFALVFLKHAEDNTSKKDEHLVPFFRDIIIAGVIFCSFFMILGFVFKQDVVSLITGLGIGGVALALASRATLENLFASFTLFTEQPFIVGDDIEIGTITGKVEKVGFRSTRIRHVDGSLVVVPNQMLVSDILNNLSERKERRHRFFLRLDITNPLEVVEKSILEIQEILDKYPKTNQKEGHVRLDSIGEFSIDVLVVFFAKTSDYWKSQEIRQEINYKISEKLKENGVKMATTPILFSEKNNKSPQK